MKDSFLRERGFNTILHLLNRLQEVHAWALSWWDSNNDTHRAACKRLGANLSLLSASFIDKGVQALTPGQAAARADVVIGVIAVMVEENAQWYEPTDDEGYVPLPDPDPKVVWVRARYRDWMVKKLNALKLDHPGVIDWWDDTNPNQIHVCTRTADNFCIILAAFLRAAITQLPNPGMRADNALTAIALRIRASAQAWEPEPENTIPE